MNIKGIWDYLWGEKPVELVKEESNLVKKSVDVPLPPGRVSKNEHEGKTMEVINSLVEIIQPDFMFEVIPAIRKLCKVNPDMSQALQDLTQLANTGHKIKFDPGVNAQQQDLMREEIENASKNWGDGVAGINGLVNKMISQVMIGGAISNEWVPGNDITFNPGITNLVFLNPENIRWGYNRRTQRYEAYQKIYNGYAYTKDHPFHIKLNPYTYKYFALNGDEDIPYGTPAYLAALEPISTQKYMLDNIKFIMEQIGLLGYGDILMDKPDQMDNESDKDYINRLENTLTKLKERAKQGMRDGLNVGFKDDHEFEFHSTTKDLGGVDMLFNNNEKQVASGLKYDAAFMGGRGNTTETMITILFTKTLSQLTNIHNIVAENLKHGYTLHLRLKGFKFKYLDVEFNKSTITDDLKYQQAQEYKLRNNRVMYADGIISLEQYADNMGYKKPDQKEPRVPIDPDGALAKAEQHKERKDQKDRSARKTRDKSKPQGTIKDKSKKL